MGLRSRLKKLWDTLGELHGPYNPAPEVKKRLEDTKGYEFKPPPLSVIWHEAASGYYDVYKNGKPVMPQLFGNKALHREYLADYEQAVVECREAVPGPKEPK